MEIGIIAEGKGDLAVLENIIVGVLDLDSEDIRFLRPELNQDNTDKAKATYQNMSAKEFGGWSLVKQDCEQQHKLKTFFEDNPFLEEDKYLVIQIDTAECENTGYDVKRPDKADENYCEELRNVVIDKINSWLGNQWKNQIHYAICIEETEAWVHTLYEDKDTSKPLNAKEAFQKYLNKERGRSNKLKKQLQKLTNKPEFDKSLFISKGFRKLSSKKGKKVLENNQSLKVFVEKLEMIKE